MRASGDPTQRREPKDVLQRAIREDRARVPAEYLGVELKLPLFRLEILEFEGTRPTLPRPIRELLGYASGFFVPPAFDVTFAGRRPAGWSAVFPAGVMLAQDSRGGFWLVDVDERTAEWGAVLYVSHEPPVVLLQAEDLAGFIEEALAWGPASRRRDWVAASAAAARHLWLMAERLISAQAARQSGDAVIEGFASRIGPRYSVADLRAAQPGTGFAYARRADRPRVVRCGAQLVFGVERPPLWRLGRGLSRLARAWRPGGLCRSVARCGGVASELEIMQTEGAQS